MERTHLEHLIIQLKKNGIKKILLLTGFQELKIRKYFQNGSKWNVSIKYSYNPAETKTALRLLFAKKLLDDYFLLLYSYNVVLIFFNGFSTIILKS